MYTRLSMGQAGLLMYDFNICLDDASQSTSQFSLLDFSKQIVWDKYT